MSAKFDEFPSLPCQDIKEKPNVTDGKTDNVKTVYNNGMNKFEQPDFSIDNTFYLFFMFVLFQLFMPRSSGEKCYENFWYTRYIHPLSTCVPSFNLLGLTVPEKSVKKIFNAWKLARKKNEKNKGINTQQQAASGKHDTATHYPHGYKVSSL